MKFLWVILQDSCFRCRNVKSNPNFEDFERRAMKDSSNMKCSQKNEVFQASSNDCAMRPSIYVTSSHVRCNFSHPNKVKSLARISKKKTKNMRRCFVVFSKNEHINNQPTNQPLALPQNLQGEGARGLVDDSVGSNWGLLRLKNIQTALQCSEVVQVDMGCWMAFWWGGCWGCWMGWDGSLLEVEVGGWR